MHLILSILLSTIVVFVTAHILPGVHLAGWGSALVVAIILGILNALIRPILLIITLPINILTLGLFTFVIMGFITWLATLIVPGFKVDNFWWCIAFALVLAILNSLVSFLKIF
jgi:putative membrane protein